MGLLMSKILPHHSHHKNDLTKNG